MNLSEGLRRRIDPLIFARVVGPSFVLLLLTKGSSALCCSDFRTTLPLLLETFSPSLIPLMGRKTLMRVCLSARSLAFTEGHRSIPSLSTRFCRTEDRS